jgi:hypothetical protein
MCPKGDDPLTDSQNQRRISLIVTGPSHFEGSLGFSFQAEKTMLPITDTISDSTIQNLLENSKKIGSVSCIHQVTHAGTTTTHTIILTFLSWPIGRPPQNNFYRHNGNPPISDFTCDTSLMDTSVSCSFSDIQTTHLKGVDFYLLFFICP